MKFHFAEDDIYLHLYKDRVEVRTSYSTSSTYLLGKYDNAEDGINVQANQHS